MGNERGCNQSVKDGAHKTIFQKIIDRELPSEIFYEDDEIICIKDKFPQAKVHLLFITKKCIPSIHEVEDTEYPLLIKIFKLIKELSKKIGIEDNYRIVINRGSQAGQTVFHLHVHLLGGEKLGSKVG